MKRDELKQELNRHIKIHEKMVSYWRLVALAMAICWLASVMFIASVVIFL